MNQPHLCFLAFIAVLFAALLAASPGCSSHVPKRNASAAAANVAPLTMSWTFDQIQDSRFLDSQSQSALAIAREASLVPGINGSAVRLGRRDSLRLAPATDFVSTGHFTIQIWIKAEWTVHRHDHGDVLNFVTSDPKQPWLWKVGFQSVETTTFPRDHWPLALRIGDGFSTAELPVIVEPWQWTHVAFVGDGDSVAIYRNGGLLGHVGYPEGGLKTTPGRSGVLQVNGGLHVELKEVWRGGVWESDLRLDDLMLSNRPVQPKVAFPADLYRPADTWSPRQRLRDLKQAAPQDTFFIDGLLRRAEQMDNGRDTADLRQQWITAASTAMDSLGVGKPALRDLRGHLKLSYISDLDQSEQFFEAYIPQSLKPAAPVPMVVALHGSGEDEGVYLARYPALKEQAEKHGWIVLTPYGRGQDGYRTSGAQDVLDVIHLAQRQWPIDTSRIYITGHSMGARGCVNLVRANPGLFAAAAPVSGWADDKDFPDLAKTPFLWIAAENDMEPMKITVQRMSEAAANANAPHKTLILPGLDHGGFLGSAWPTVVEKSLPAVFDFFAEHGARAAARP